jgi:hypothetical protein
MSTSPEEPAQTVRFSDVNQEIEPDAALQHVTDITGGSGEQEECLSPEAEEVIRNVAMTLQKSRCQARRMENFSYEPVSLPTSRVRRNEFVNMTIAGLIASRLRLQRPHRERPQVIRSTVTQPVLALLRPFPPCILPRLHQQAHHRRMGSRLPQ